MQTKTTIGRGNWELEMEQSEGDIRMGAICGMLQTTKRP